MEIQKKQDFPTLQEYLNYRFIYENGELYWRTHIQHNTIVGKKVAKKKIGRRGDRRFYVKVDGKNKLMHKVIWLMHHGEVPEGKVIDHEDRNRFNNNIKNLRLLTNQQNLLNTDKVLQAHNTSGYRGVRKKNPDRINCWAAEISYLKKRKCIGSFPTAKEAAIYRDKYIDDHNLPLIKNF